MKRVRVTLFGGPRVEVGGQSVRLSPYQLYIVSVLFGHDGRGVSRGRLVGLLWGSVSEGKARRRLSQHLYELSRRVPDLALDSVGDRIVPASSAVWSDLDEFQTFLRQGKLAKAGELLARGLFAGIDDPPSREFEDWLQGRSLSVRSALRDRASAVWSAAKATGDWPMARTAAEVLLVLDPMDERALRRVLQSKAMVGQVHEAEATYRAFAERSVLLAADDDPEWVPAPETGQLLERIRALDDGAPTLSPFPLQPEAPFCGRSGELARLRKLLAVAPEQGIVTGVVSGEGGIGKTRIVEESLAAAHLAGMRVLRGRSSEFEQRIPLSPILEAFDDAHVGRALLRLQHPWRTVLLALMPQFNESGARLPDLGYIQPDSVPRRLYEAMHRLLIEVVRDGPLCLVLDDFHWADETSLTVLDFLRRRWTSGGLVMVVSVRPEAVPPDSSVARFLLDTRTTAAVERIELEELDPEAADNLITAVAGNRQVPAEMRSYIRALGGSNPFFLIELTLEHLAGRLTDSGVAGEITVPLSIRQLFSERLERLSDEAKQVAWLLAVIGREVGFDGLGEIAGLEPAILLGMVEELSDLRLVRFRPTGVRPQHGLFQKSVYQSLSEPRRTLLHRRIAEHLLHDDPTSVGELALHAELGGLPHMALRYSLEAAESAEGSGALAEAVQYLRTALRVVEDSTTETDIVARLANLSYSAGDYDNAVSYLERVSQGQLACGDREGSLLSQVRLAHAVSHQSQPAEDALALLRLSKSEARDEEYWEVVAEALDVEIHLLDRAIDKDGMLLAFDEARECVEKGPAAAKVRALSTLAIQIYYGDPQEALRSARRAVSIALDNEIDAAMPKALERLLLVMLYQGLFETEEARLALSTADRLASRSGDPDSKIHIRLNESVWLLDTGQLDRAEWALQRAAETVRHTQAIWPRLVLELNRAELALARCQYDEAGKAYRMILDHEETPKPSWVEQIAHAGAGISALHSGDLGLARSCELLLDPAPARWTFDPCLIVIFQANMLNRRGELDSAIRLLESVSEDLEGRMIPAWLKLQLFQVSLLERRDVDRAHRLATHASRVAEARGLKVRQGQLDAVQQRLSHGG